MHFKTIMRRLSKNDSTLEVLDLSHYKLDNVDLKKLVNKLSINTTVVSLNLSNNLFRVGMGKIIAWLLENNLTLKTLVLKYNKIGCKDAEYIAKALYNNFQLRTLDLSNNEISIDAVLAIMKSLTKNPSLKNLDISENKASLKKNHSLVDGSMAVDFMMPLFFFVDLGIYAHYKNKLSCFVHYLKNTSGLQNLKMCSMYFDGEARKGLYKSLQKNTSIRYLGLSHGGYGWPDSFSKSFAKVLKRNNTLSSIDINFSDQSDQSLLKKTLVKRKENESISKDKPSIQEKKPSQASNGLFRAVTCKNEYGSINDLTKIHLSLS